MKTYILKELNEHIRSAIEYFDLSEKDKIIFINIIDEIYKTAWQSGYDEHRILTICEIKE